MGTRGAFSVRVLGDRDWGRVVVVDKGTPTVLGPKHTAITYTEKSPYSQTHVGNTNSYNSQLLGNLLT